MDRCPACSQGYGRPRIVTTILGGGVAVTVTCDVCGHDWSYEERDPPPPPEKPADDPTIAAE